MYKVLPPAEQKLQLWAQGLPEIEDAENSQREWSGEYFAKWLAARFEYTGVDASPGMLAEARRHVVLTRAEGGYDDGQDVPAAQMEKERKEGQTKLAALSTNSRQIILHCGHNMELEAPEDVTSAIRQVVEAARHRAKL